MPAEDHARARRVLVVDDDQDFREVIRQTLESAGYEPVCVASVDEAVREMESRLPRLVVTDLVMGQLDAGFALGRRIKSDPRWRDTPVIVVTAIGSQRGFDFRPQGEPDLETMGADAFLRKPFSPDALLDVIEGVLGESETAL